MKRLLLLVSVWLMLSVSYAQTTTLDGPEATMLPNASTWVLENNQDELVFATLNPGINGSVEDLRIYHYNKATRKMTEQSVDDDLECRFVFPKEDLWCVVNMVNNKKTKSVDYGKGVFSKMVPKVKKMEFSPLYSAPKNGKNIFYHCIDFSEDHSKFAIMTVLKPNSWKTPQHDIDIAVFDQDGTPLWHQHQTNNWFINENTPFYLANDGVVYVVVSGSSSNVINHIQDSLHISVYTQNGVENIIENIGRNAVFHCGKALLKDNRLVVSGVACPEGRNSNQLWTYFVDGAGHMERVESDLELPSNPEGYIYNVDVYQSEAHKFLPYIHEIKELKDGKILLVGEQTMRAQTGTVISMSGADEIMGYLSRNLFCTVLSPQGEVLETKVYPRATSTREVYRFAVSVNAPGVFDHDGDLYLLYNEHKANFGPGNHRMWTLLQENRAGQCCVVLSKTGKDNELENKVLYTAGPFPYPQQPALTGNYEYFLRILAEDENAVYYLLKHDTREFRVEKITW
jgi:hypothetical protein